MFLTGKPLRSAYRVIARDGRVIWFHCEAKMIRQEDGRPWFIHGVGFDITDLKQTEEALEEERNVVSAILDTVGALVVVLDPKAASFGSIVPANAAPDTRLRKFGESTFGTCLFLRRSRSGFRGSVREVARRMNFQSDYECPWVARHGNQRLIAWSSTLLPGGKARPTTSSPPASTSPNESTGESDS